MFLRKVCSCLRGLPVFKAKMLIFPSKANLNEKISFDNIIHLSQEAGKQFVWEPSFTFHSGP